MKNPFKDVKIGNLILWCDGDVWLVIKLMKINNDKLLSHYNFKYYNVGNKSVHSFPIVNQSYIQHRIL